MKTENIVSRKSWAIESQGKVLMLLVRLILYAFLSLGIDEILQPERIDDSFTPRLIVFVQHRQLAESLSNWINKKSATDSKPYNSSRFVSQNVTGDASGQKIIHIRLPWTPLE